MPKSLAEIERIARDRRLDALAGLSDVDLHVLLATLNRQATPDLEEESFARFYLEVVNRIKNRPI